MNMRTIEQRVMANIFAVYVFRRVTDRAAVPWYMLACSMLGLSWLVSIPHVAENFLHVTHYGAYSAAMFLVAAVTGTELLVQIVAAAGVGAVALLLLESVDKRAYAWS